MGLERILVLSLLVAQTLSAPNGCTELCSSSYHRHHPTQTSSDLQDHAALTQGSSQFQDADYSRPGNWSQHNEFKTDGGRGRVHEERGQYYVDGPKRVRYYSKNYSSSYNTNYANGAGLSEGDQQNVQYRHSVRVPSSQQILDSQRTYDQIGDSESVRQQHEYNRVQSQTRDESSRRIINSQSQRLEDLGEHLGFSQQVQHEGSGYYPQVSQSNTAPGQNNWSRVDSFKTDGGHGRVFEEEGQYVTGPKKVRYYKRNYTSSYASNGAIPTPDIATTGVHDLQRELEKLHREIGSEFHRASVGENAGSSGLAQSNIGSIGLDHDNVQTVETNGYRHRIDQESLSSTIDHNSQQRISDASSISSEQQQQHVPYVNPTQTYGTARHSTYERHEGYESSVNPSSQYLNPTSGYTNVLVAGNVGYARDLANSETSQQRVIDDLQRTERWNGHQSQLTQSQGSRGDIRENSYNQRGSVLPETTGQVSQYKEQWSSSSHTRESSGPQFATGGLHSGEERAQYSRDQYGNRHNSYRVEEGDRRHYDEHRESNYNSGHGTKTGRFVTGAIDLGQVGGGADCTQEAEQVEYGSRHHRKYKRSAKYGELSDTQQTEDLTRQDQEFDSQVRQEKQGETDDLLQATADSDDLRQTLGKLEFGQRVEHSHRQNIEFGQQASGNIEFGQQTSGNIEFGQQATGDVDFGQQATGDVDFGQQATGDVDFGQQTTGDVDFGQQTTGNIEFGQQTQNPHQRPSKDNQHFEDLAQQTSEFDDLTQQQTSGKIELGQQTRNPHQRPSTGNQHFEDLAQQTSEFDDLTQQQTSGKIELGQQTRNPHQRPSTGNQHFEDLAQQTSEFDDLTQQQTSGKIELGQQTRQPYPSWKPSTKNQHSGDSTQQTNGFDDLTQQTSGNINLEQDKLQYHNPPRKLDTGDSYMKDVSKQTGDFDDLTQQTTGKLEIEVQPQYPYSPRGPSSGNQQLGGVTKQKDADDLTQQTTGKFEIEVQPQYPYPPRGPSSGNQQLGGVTKQKDADDLTQQTTGSLELGQQTQYPYPPRKPGTGNQHMEDLSQKTDGFDDLTQQTSGNLEFGQQTQYPYPSRGPNSGNQQLGGVTKQKDADDLTQQTTGKLEIEVQPQYPYPPRGPSSGNQQLGGVTEQKDADDLTQQTTGSLELGQQTQYPYPPRKTGTGNQHMEDLSQKTDGFDDLTQQTSGNLEFGQQTQYPYPSWKPSTGNQHLEDSTQQTGGYDDLSQQTSGNLGFGQQPNPSRKPSTDNQHSEDLTQQTGSFDHITQQTSGHFEFGQQTRYPYPYRKPTTGNQYKEDLTQQTGGFDDFTQQTSGDLGKLGQQTQYPYSSWKPSTENQHSGDLTQQTGGFDDLTQQTSGNFNFEQDRLQYPNDDLTKQSGRIPFDVRALGQKKSDSNLAKPAEKPKPRYSRVGSAQSQTRGRVDDQQRYGQQNPHPDDGDISVTDIHEVPPKVETEADVGKIRDKEARGDQGLTNLAEKETSKDSNKQTQQNAFDFERGHVDQINRLHKSNDATVGVQWHYTYHPSDLTNSEPTQNNFYPSFTYHSGTQQKETGGQVTQQLDQKENDNYYLHQQRMQNRHRTKSTYQQSSHVESSHSQQNFDEQEYQQSSHNQLGHASGSHQQHPHFAFGQQVEQIEGNDNIHRKVGRLEIEHQTAGGVKGSRRQNQIKLEPRIIEAYGGGPYDATHDDNIYEGVTANPSATLPPVYTDDSWVIQELPRAMAAPRNDLITVSPVNITQTLPETTPSPSFWGRLGHKITSTYDKAKEKAKNIFG